MVLMYPPQYSLNNLSVASRVHILEPQWNPSVESQAIGRVLRLGQIKQVCVIRYITDRTIEEVRQSACMRPFTSRPNQFGTER